MNLIRVIIETSYEHLKTFKISPMFSKTLKSYGSFCFAIFLMKSIAYTFTSANAIEILRPILESHKDVAGQKILWSYNKSFKIYQLPKFNAIFLKYFDFILILFFPQML